MKGNIRKMCRALLTDVLLSLPASQVWVMLTPYRCDIIAEGRWWSGPVYVERHIPDGKGQEMSSRRGNAVCLMVPCTAQADAEGSFRCGAVMTTAIILRALAPAW